MKEMLTLCTKNVHFTFNGDIYLQTDDVAIGFPLRPVLAGIFMVHLKRSLVPVSFWKRYVYDTITFIKIGSAKYLLSILNSFHPNIGFTYETQVNSKLEFLDVLLLREGQNIVTTVCRKFEYLSQLEFVLPSDLETRNFKFIGSKNTLNFLDRRFIENRVKPYTEGFP